MKDSPESGVTWERSHDVNRGTPLADTIALEPAISVLLSNTLTIMHSARLLMKAWGPISHSECEANGNSVILRKDTCTCFGKCVHAPEPPTHPHKTNHHCCLWWSNNILIFTLKALRIFLKRPFPSKPLSFLCFCASQMDRDRKT